MAEMMKAWRINELGKPPVMEEVPIPEPTFGEILIKMKGAGMCRTDLEVIDEGFITVPFEGPFTFGHENAGEVVKLGPGVDTVEVGQNVIVDTLHACGKCQYCLSGRDNFCEVASARGLKEDGGMAEYMIADAREVAPLGDLDPTEYVALADAGLSPYGAVQTAKPFIPNNGTAVVIGVGGLGFYCCQYLALTTSARVIVVNRSADKMAKMTDFGADELVVLDDNAYDKIMELTDGKGVDAVFDFVGRDNTLELAAQITKGLGLISILGLGGGTLPVSWTTVKPGVMVRLTQGGTITDLYEIMDLAKAGKITVQAQKYPFSKVLEALDDLRNGRVEGRAVITFEEFDE